MTDIREIVIKPNAYYQLSDAAHLLGISFERLLRESNESRLRTTDRAGLTYTRGQWLIDWLDTGCQTIVKCQGGRRG